MPPADPSAPLTADELAAACALPVLDADGKSVKFGELFAEHKTIVVLIRHFWCGACQDYVAQLATVPDTVRLVVVGCGEPSMIQEYKEVTGFKHAMYADPTRKLYDALGAVVRLAGPEQRPDYVRDGAVVGALRAIWRGPLSHLTQLGKQGNISQLGGDFVLGPGPTSSFAWRMRNTQDHIPVAELLKHAGVEPAA